MNGKRIIISSSDEIMEINKRLGETVLNRNSMDSLIAKIESKYKDRDFTRQVAKIAAIMWMDIIQLHPFLDGNKRTATEAVMLFLKNNGFILDTTTAGKVFISLKIMEKL
ncbi:MAG TPA: Fic family protein [archaeon]|nr:Fic family protein [archaeon]